MATKQKHLKYTRIKQFQNGVIPYGYKTCKRYENDKRAFQNGVIPYGYKTISNH